MFVNRDLIYPHSHLAFLINLRLLAIIWVQTKKFKSWSIYVFEFTHRRLTELEESQRDQGRTLSLSQVKVKYLEEENGSLQQRVDSLTLQKHNLDRIVKEYQMERHREVRVASTCCQRVSERPLISACFTFFVKMILFWKSRQPVKTTKRLKANEC